jgi:hypothetical protein
MRARTTGQMAVSRSPIGGTAAGGFTAPQLAAAVSLVLVLALAVPALTATVVQRRRVGRAVADVTRIASLLGSLGPGDLAGSNRAAGTTGTGSPLRTLVGPGELPKSPRYPEWLTGRSDTLANQLAAGGPPRANPSVVASAKPALWPPEIGADPWGNCYIVNVGSGSGFDASSSGWAPARAVWVLSAGSNGTIETPYGQSSANAAVGGDDVAVRVWR